MISGLCLRADGRSAGRSPRTAVAVPRARRGLLEWYLETGEWRERAGGYAIQGRGAALVAAIEGDYLNVVGLPVAVLLDLEPDLPRGIRATLGCRAASRGASTGRGALAGGPTSQSQLPGPAGDRLPGPQLSWLLIFVKWLLVIPHCFALILLGLIGARGREIISWFTVLFTSGYRRGIFNYMMGDPLLPQGGDVSVCVTDEYPTFAPEDD